MHPPLLAATLAAALLALPLAAPGATYRWIDDRGVVNYGNAPPPAARQVRQLDEEAGRVSTIQAVPREQLQHERERVLEARIDRLERELDDARRAAAAVPTTLPVRVPVPVAGFAPSWFAVGTPQIFRSGRHPPPFRVIGGPRPSPHPGAGWRLHAQGVDR
jgi:hypothetical protein